MLALPLKNTHGCTSCPFCEHTGSFTDNVKYVCSKASSRNRPVVYSAAKPRPANGRPNWCPLILVEPETVREVEEIVNEIIDLGLVRKRDLFEMGRRLSSTTLSDCEVAKIVLEYISKDAPIAVELNQIIERLA